MSKPHKHAELIKAWADGAEIEWFDTYNKRWLPCAVLPYWYPHVQYRLKSQPHKWQKEMDAQAAGKMIQYRPINIPDGCWRDIVHARFDCDIYEYRVKPDTMVVYGNISNVKLGPDEDTPVIWTLTRSGGDNLALSFEDGVLVAAEVLKK